MSRGRKLLIAGLVLVVGFGLAWPFRKTTADKTFESPVAAQNVGVNRSKRVAMQQPTSRPQLPGMSPGLARETTPGPPQPMRSPGPHVVAKMASIGDAGMSGASGKQTASFDLANHPALAGLPRSTATSPVTPPVPPHKQSPLRGYLPAETPRSLANARPAYTTAERDTRKQSPAEVRHVVQNSDTLEKLAKRYLGDEGRALEIFDLNRDVLDNPHLLPIDAQLRIPARTAATTPNTVD